jgi:hypothetical protein
VKKKGDRTKWRGWFMCDEKGGMEEEKKRKGKKGNRGLCVNAKGEGEEKGGERG